MRITITLGILILLTGGLACSQRATASPAPGTDESQRAMGIVPCDTDSDCERKNPLLAKDEKPIYYCEAITKAGTRCKRRVAEPGLLCKQHSKMVAAGKTVKTVDD